MSEYKGHWYLKNSTIKYRTESRVYIARLYFAHTHSNARALIENRFPAMALAQAWLWGMREKRIEESMLFTPFAQ